MCAKVIILIHSTKQESREIKRKYRTFARWELLVQTDRFKSTSNVQEYHLQK